MHCTKKFDNVRRCNCERFKGRSMQEPNPLKIFLDCQSRFIRTAFDFFKSGVNGTSDEKLNWIFSKGIQMNTIWLKCFLFLFLSTVVSTPLVFNLITLLFIRHSIKTLKSQMFLE